MSKLYDPLFKGKKFAKNPENSVETAKAADTRSLEEIALVPQPGLSVRKIYIGAHNERIEAWLHPETRTVYPVKE